MKYQESLPIFDKLSNRDTLLANGEIVHLAAGDALFHEGEMPRYLLIHHSGTCMLSRNARPLREARSDQLLDLVSVLGGIPHSLTAIAITDCEFRRWDLTLLWQDEGFRAGARRYLAEQLQAKLAKLDELQAPVRYQPQMAQLYPGPFVFPNCTIIFAFCRVQNDNLRLPPGVSRIGKGLLIGIADFPSAYYHHDPDSRFSYTETTFFLPVRVGVRLGLYVPLIYPSAYEPILLGREIYGFPKQLGDTLISDSRARLWVGGAPVIEMNWDKKDTVNESRIVGSFGQLFGVTGRITAAAFAIGDTLLSMMNVPFYRRVSVFNHKRVAGTDTRQDALTYDVDQLTQAIFSVEHWQRIDHLPQAQVEVSSGITRQWNISLEAAYHTQLTMRLSTGRILRDYRRDTSS